MHNYCALNLRTPQINPNIVGGHLSDADPTKCWLQGHELGKLQGGLGQHLGQNHMKVKMADGLTGLSGQPQGYKPDIVAEPTISTS